ncbi:MAG: response regulator [Gemmatimonadetes bacterium]|nr:response regulator [Gemmatimonadota bacterium]
MDILVIEDDPTVQQIIAKALERGGYMVKCVGNGLQALAELQDATFRAIVCDVGLPFLEGKSLYDHIKAEYPEMAARMLFVTGMANEPETRRFLDRTGRPVVAKPFELNELLSAVRSVAEHASRTPQSVKKPKR